MMRKGNVVLFILFFSFHAVQSQDFKWKSALDTVPKTDYYGITLGVEWLAVLKSDLSDIRIKNEKNEVVDFIIKEHTIHREDALIGFTVLQSKTNSAHTIIELDAGNWPGGDHLCLVIGNNAVEREGSLSGSNDRQQWFVIHERFRLSNVKNYSDVFFLNWLYFPRVRYRYLKLKIKNQGSDALPILKAGYINDTIANEYVTFTTLPKTNFKAIDSSDGNTYVWINTVSPYPVDRISMKVSGPRFYKPKVMVYRTEGTRITDLLSATEFNSGKEPVIMLRGNRVQTMVAVIENGDNPPLKIEAVSMQCRERQLLAYLEAGKRYYLVGGNEAAVKPKYYLELFMDSIPAYSQMVSHGNLVPVTEEVNNTNDKNRTWLWPTIIGMIAILGLLTVRLMREMRKKNI